MSLILALKLSNSILAHVLLGVVLEYLCRYIIHRVYLLFLKARGTRQRAQEKGHKAKGTKLRVQGKGRTEQGNGKGKGRRAQFMGVKGARQGIMGKCHKIRGKWQ